VLWAEVAEEAASGTGLAKRPDVNRRTTESEAFILMNREVGFEALVDCWDCANAV
jgi:hypothetical protein